MIVGWDISTSIIGVAIFKDDGTYFASRYLDLRKIDDLNVKADAARTFVQGIKAELHVYGNHQHFVEERLGNFSSGRTMLQVLMKLAAFNALVSFFIWDELDSSGSKISFVHPSTWKALMKKQGLIIPKGSKEKKQITLDFVKKLEPEFKIDLNRNEKSQPWMYDMADAYCIGKAGFLKSCNELVS